MIFSCYSIFSNAIVWHSLQGKIDVPLNSVEQLYEAMLPNLPQYMVSSVSRF